jgi:hypothetical protein
LGKLSNSEKSKQAWLDKKARYHALNMTSLSTALRKFQAPRGMDPNPRTCPAYDLGGLPRHIFEIGGGLRGHEVDLNNDLVPAIKKNRRG